jgi:hypothetical protein
MQKDKTTSLLLLEQWTGFMGSLNTPAPSMVMIML